MRIDEASEPTFARHETFHPRLGWFRKAFLAASKDNGGFFLAEDAPIRLGVGKNMVRSIRFWGTAARLITDVVHPESARMSYTMPTNFGVRLLGPDGLDPQMEDPATWWWIHWMLLAPRSALPVWWILLNEMKAVEFDDALSERVCVEAIEASPWDVPNLSSIHKDVTAFIRTYSHGVSGRGRFDDQFGSPLRDLRLVTPSTAGYRLATGIPRNLPAEIVVAAIMDFIAMTSSSASTALLSRLANEPGSPGRVFRLSEDLLGQVIAPVVEASNLLSLSAPAGAVQLGWKGAPAQIGHQLLCDYFDADGDSERPSLVGPIARQANFDPLIGLLLAEHSRGVVL